MKLLHSERSIHIVLSKANLLALLHKVDQPDSAKMIYRRDGDTVITVSAELDADHYKDRDRGLMANATEAFINQHKGEGK